MDKVNKYQCKPTWGLGLLVGIMSLFMIVLGFWQLQRAEEKRALQTEMDSRYALEPVELHESLGDRWQQLRYQLVRVKGHFLADKQVLMDNRIYKGKAGYHCITPLQVSGTEPKGGGLTVLVNRGWVATGNDRAVLPTINTPAGEVELLARISPPQSKPPLLPDGSLPDSYSQKVWAFLDLDYFQDRKQIIVEPYILLAQTDLRDDLAREWPRFDGKMGMHIGYAIQWFLLAFILVIVVVVASCKKTEQREQDERIG